MLKKKLCSVFQVYKIETTKHWSPWLWWFLLLILVGSHDHNTAWSVPGITSSAVPAGCDLGKRSVDERVHHLHPARTQHHLLCGQPLPPLPHHPPTALQQKGLLFLFIYKFIHLFLKIHLIISESDVLIKFSHDGTLYKPKFSAWIQCLFISLINLFLKIQLSPSLVSVLIINFPPTEHFINLSFQHESRPSIPHPWNQR